MSKDSITYQAASTIAATLVNSFAIAGQRESAGRLLEVAASTSGGFTVHYSCGWNCDCDLSLNFSPVSTTRMIAKVTVNWPASNRDPLAALVSLVLYRQVADLAALIQTQLNDEVIVVE